LREYIFTRVKCFGFFSINPDLYELDTFQFSDKGMEGSGEGNRYDTMAWFARFWGWTYDDFMRLPIRVRNKLFNVLEWQLEKMPPTTL
jgi:hypothetical protein